MEASFCNGADGCQDVLIDGHISGNGNRIAREESAVFSQPQREGAGRVAWGVQHLQCEAALQMQDISVLQCSVDLDRSAHQGEKAGNRALFRLQVHILYPCLFRSMSSHGAAGNAFDGCGCANVIGVSVGEDERGDLLWASAGCFQIVQNDLL